MLVESPRLLPQDRAEWARRARYDRAHIPSAQRLADTARAAIAEWAADRYTVPVAVSWGKDSVVVADLALTSSVADRVRLVWVRQRWFENPDSLTVRDVFLARHPHVAYEERWVTTPYPRRWDDDATATYRPPAPRTGGVWPADRVTGIRAEESDARRMSANVHGTSTTRTCRPILGWRQEHVFGYLAAHDLPVHPVYAMTTQGGLDRPALRVHSLGGLPGLRHRGPWEDAYYGRVIHDDRVGVAVMRALPHTQTRRRAASAVAVDVARVVPDADVADVNRALLRLHTAGLVARWERYGQTGWYRWADKPWPIPGSHTAGDLVP